MNAMLLFVLAQVGAATSPQQDLADSGMEVQVWRETLHAEHCTDCIDAQRKDPDLPGEALAAKLAELHERRVALLLTLDAPPHEIASERLAAADAWMDAFSLDPDRTEHIKRAEQQLLTAENAVADPEASVHKVAQRAKRRLAALVPVLEDSSPPEAPILLPVKKTPAGPSGAVVKQPDPPKAPRERRLRVRIEGGYALHMYETDEPQKVHYRAAAGYLHTALLGRFPFRRLAVAFGPYFSWFRTDPGGFDSYADAIDSGAHVGLEVYFSAGSRRAVSLQPFIEFGVGRIHPHHDASSSMANRPVGSAMSGATFAPGLSLCFLEGTICPTVRFKILPDLTGFDYAPQIGLAFNFPPTRPLRQPRPR